MDSKTNLPQDATPSYEEQYLGKSPRRMWTRTKIIVAVFTMLGIVAAIVGVCAVVVVVVVFPAEKNDGELHVMDLESNERLKSIIVENGMSAAKARRQGPNRSNARASCSSETTNDSIPMAHIGGRGIKWGTTEPPRPAELTAPGYRTRWICNQEHGNTFVKGGMNFSQADQRLYFPEDVCGYYYISSQVLFQYSSKNNRPNQNISAFHGIEIRPNCGPHPGITSYLYSHSSLVQREHIRTSTYIGDVAKICGGGSIKIIIPVERNLCCAQGDSMSTHFSTFLVQETACS